MAPSTESDVHYSTYIKSPEWAKVRRRYWSSKLPKCCYICGSFKRPMQLHHRTYKNLGRERLTDLVPVHAKCHRLIHALHDHRDNHKQSLWASTKKARDLYGPKKAVKATKARKKPARRRRVRKAG